MSNNKVVINSKPDDSDEEYILINEACVSKILSCPTDKHVKLILKIVQEKNLKNAYNQIVRIINENGMSLSELITCIYEHIMDSIINSNNEIVKYSIDKCVSIIKNMSIINENLTLCNNDNIQIASFIGIFYI